MSPPTPHPEKKPSTPLPVIAPIPTPASAAPSPRSRPGLILPIVAGIAFLAIVYFFGIAPRLSESAKLSQEQTLSADHRVVYAVARLAAPKMDLTLPGTIEAFQQASIYARTSGYVKRWLVEIGDVVHQGDLLAELDTPDIDQQLNQAKAQAEHSKATLTIAQLAADRWNLMIKTHAVSQEEADEKNATRDEAKAQLDADLANVAKLIDQQNFKNIVAPFDGKITYRNIEVGNLISAGTDSSTTGGSDTTGSTKGTTEIYRITQTDPLRVYVDVPESSSRSIVPGVKASIHLQSYPDRVFTGEVVRSAGAIDNATRTLRTEIQVSNKDGALLPGTFCEVRLALVDTQPTVLIPANTLIVNSAGTQVARLDPTDDTGHFKVHLMAVKVGRDFGTEVEIVQDLQDGDQLVTNAPADLSDGMIVTIQPVAAPPPVTTPDMTIRKS